MIFHIDIMETEETEREKAHLCEEGGLLGSKIGTHFFAIVNFTFKIMHFIGDDDLGKKVIV